MLTLLAARLDRTAQCARPSPTTTCHEPAGGPALQGSGNKTFVPAGGPALQGSGNKTFVYLEYICGHTPPGCGRPPGRPAVAGGRILRPAGRLGRCPYEARLLRAAPSAARPTSTPSLAHGVGWGIRVVRAQGLSSVALSSCRRRLAGGLVCMLPASASRDFSFLPPLRAGYLFFVQGAHQGRASSERRTPRSYLWTSS